MPAQTSIHRNPSEAAPVRRSKEEYYNVGPEEDPEATNLEGIPEEATGTPEGVKELAKEE